MLNLFKEVCVYLKFTLLLFFSLLKMNLFKTGCDTFTVSGNRGKYRKWCLMGDVGILTYETDPGETWWIMMYVGPCELGIMGKVGRDKLKKKVSKKNLCEIKTLRHVGSLSDGTKENDCCLQWRQEAGHPWLCLIGCCIFSKYIFKTWLFANNHWWDHVYSSIIRFWISKCH